MRFGLRDEIYEKIKNEYINMLVELKVNLMQESDFTYGEKSNDFCM